MRGTFVKGESSAIADDEGCEPVRSGPRETSPLDPFDEAVAFAVREAMRRRGEDVARADGGRVIVVDGGNRKHVRWTDSDIEPAERGARMASRSTASLR